MAKLFILREGQVVQEVELHKDRMTVGRKLQNDIVLPNSAVSGEHAVLNDTADGVFLEDLGSTNGTFVNGRRVNKCLLEAHDVIVMGKFQLEFVAGPRVLAAATVPDGALMIATVTVKTGPNAGKTLTLTEPVSTLGRPGVQVIAITRQNNAFFCTHVDGHPPALLNGRPMSKVAQRLNHGDALEVVGGNMIFSLTPA